MWDDLVEAKSTGTRAWLDLLPDEVAPQVLESVRPSRVVWSSLWPDRPKDRVVIEIASSGGESAVTFTLLAAGDPPDDSKTGHVRKRVNHLLWADLRFSYGN